YGGLWPGIFATLISSIIAWYAFLPPYDSFVVSDPTGPEKVILFSLAGVLISLLAESLHRSKRTNLDIGQRERAERERFHVTLASIGDGVIAADSQGQVRFINQVATSL